MSKYKIQHAAISTQQQFYGVQANLLDKSHVIHQEPKNVTTEKGRLLNYIKTQEMKLAPERQLGLRAEGLFKLADNKEQSVANELPELITEFNETYNLVNQNVLIQKQSGTVLVPVTAANAPLGREEVKKFFSDAILGENKKIPNEDKSLFDSAFENVYGKSVSPVVPLEQPANPFDKEKSSKSSRSSQEIELKVIQPVQNQEEREESEEFKMPTQEELAEFNKEFDKLSQKLKDTLGIKDKGKL